MQRRRELMAMQTGGLPSAYRRVEYIQSTGSQYILLPLYSIDLNLIGFETKSEFADSLSNNRTFSATRVSSWTSSVYSVSFGLSSYNHYRLITSNAAGYASNAGINVDYTIGDISEIALHGTTISYNGTAYTYQRTIQGIITSKIAIFGSFAANAVTEIPNAKVYYYRLFDGDTVVFNGIPCVRKSDNKPGMYDTVSKTFYTNDGTGEFIVPA